MAKRKASTKNASDLTRGQKVAKTRKELGEIRARIRKMNSVQLGGFFSGFDGKEIKAIERAIAKAKREKSAEKIRKLEAARARIDAEIAALGS